MGEGISPQALYILVAIIVLNFNHAGAYHFLFNVKDIKLSHLIHYHEKCKSSDYQIHRSIWTFQNHFDPHSLSLPLQVTA